MHNKSLDGLRGLAALNVVFAHFIGAFFPSSYLVGNYLPFLLRGERWGTVFKYNNFDDILNLIFMPFFSFFYGGTFAVSIFFVISGYVLTLPYYTDQCEKLKARIIVRYIRLNIPIIIISLISMSILVSGLYWNMEASKVLENNWLNLFFKDIPSIVNFLKLEFYETIFYGAGSLIPPIWTMKIEFFGSIFLMGYYLIKPKIFTKYFFAMGFLMICITEQNADGVFFIAMFCGSFLSKINFSKKINPYIFLAGLILGSTQTSSNLFDILPNSNFLGAWASNKLQFYTCIGAYLIVASIKNGFGMNLLQHKVCSFFGNISYSMYLVHMLILCSITSYMYLQIKDLEYCQPILFISYMVITFIVSNIAYLYLDRPSINLSRAIGKLLKF